jgi:hypothetical protein
MTTKIRCEFIGGPKDGQVVDMRSDQCSESFAVPASGWIAVISGRLRRFEQNEAIPAPKPADWHSFVRSVYLRVHKLHPHIVYWYMRDELVERCRANVGNSRCMNEAMPGGIGCTLHPRGSVISYRSGVADRRKSPREARGRFQAGG